MTFNPSLTEPQARLRTAMASILERSAITNHVLDLELYYIQVALLWIQVVAAPEDIGISQNQLEQAYDWINEEITSSSNSRKNLRSIFILLLSSEGKKTMKRLKIKSHHRDLIKYFGVMMTDPEEHKKRMQQARSDKLY